MKITTSAVSLACALAASIWSVGASFAADQSGMQIGCAFGMQDDDNTKRKGLAVFLPERGTGRHNISADQIYDPDHVLNDGGFNVINIENSRSELTGANKMALNFSGGEIYEGTLQGKDVRGLAAWCVVSNETDAKSGFARFAETMTSLRRPLSNNREGQQ